MKQFSIKNILSIARDLVLLPMRAIRSGGGELIYFPRSYSDIPEYSDRMDAVEQLEFESDGFKQTAYLDVDPEAQPSRIWLLFGGNGALALDWLPITSFAPESSDGFVLVEYPGYGLSEGRPSPDSIRRCVDDLIRALQLRFELSESAFRSKTGVMGHSLGAAVAMDTAARIGISKVVLVSPFTSMKALATKMAGRGLVRFLRHHYDNVEAIRNWCESVGAEHKVIVFHGTDDELIPLAMSEEIAATFPERIQLESVEGADHNGILLEIRDQLLALLVEVKQK